MRDFWYQDCSELIRVRLDNVDSIKLKELKDYRGWSVVFVDHEGFPGRVLSFDSEKEAKEVFGIVATKLCGDKHD